MAQSVEAFLSKVKNTEVFKRGIDDIVSLREKVPLGFRGQTVGSINDLLKDLVTKKTAAGMKDQAEYAQSKLPAGDKKGF
jgi:hypothetical protein